MNALQKINKILEFSETKCKTCNNFPYDCCIPTRTFLKMIDKFENEEYMFVFIIDGRKCPNYLKKMLV